MQTETLASSHLKNANNVASMSLEPAFKHNSPGRLDISLLDLRASAKTLEEGDNPVKTPAMNARRPRMLQPTSIAQLDAARNRSQINVGFNAVNESRKDRNRLIFGSIASGGYETTS